MKTYHAILEETFEDDTTTEIVHESQTIEQISELMEKLNGKSFPILQISLSGSKFPRFHLIGGPDQFSLSLRKNESSWQEYLNPEQSTSNWQLFGLGYHNWELEENKLCNKQIAIKAMEHFCLTGGWLTGLPYRDNSGNGYQNFSQHFKKLS